MSDELEDEWWEVHEHHSSDDPDCPHCDRDVYGQPWTYRRLAELGDSIARRIEVHCGDDVWLPLLTVSIADVDACPLWRIAPCTEGTS